MEETGFALFVVQILTGYAGRFRNRDHLHYPATRGTATMNHSIAPPYDKELIRLDGDLCCLGSFHDTFTRRICSWS
jgi:hypothetical protein